MVMVVGIHHPPKAHAAHHRTVQDQCQRCQENDRQQITDSRFHLNSGNVACARMKGRAIKKPRVIIKTNPRTIRHSISATDSVGKQLFPKTSKLPRTPYKSAAPTEYKTLCRTRCLTIKPFIDPQCPSIRPAPKPTSPTSGNKPWENLLDDANHPLACAGDKKA